MTLDELKQHKDGVCLGYSTIDYLLTKVYPYNTPECPHLKGYKDFGNVKLYPRLLYINNEQGEGILCRLMFGKLHAPVGLLNKPSTYQNTKYEHKTYISPPSVKLPIDTNIDSIYEVKD